jgi:hypothetical protein
MPVEVPLINFTLSGLNANLTMDLSGTLAGEAPTALDVSATAIYYVKTSDMLNVFKFQTDSFDVNDLSASDIKYYVFRDASGWPVNLKINPAHAAMSAGAKLTAGVDASKNLLKHDFVRYLAESLFNTVHGVDLFSNEDALLENIAFKGQGARTAIELALDKVNTTYVAAGYLTSAVDASGYRYTTNALTGNTNICRELMRQIANGAASRFAGTVASTLHQSVPLVNGDTLNFKVTVAAADNQHDLTGRTGPFDTRVYKIQLILCADGGISNNVVPVDSALYPLEYPYGVA